MSRSRELSDRVFEDQSDAETGSATDAWMNALRTKQAISFNDEVGAFVYFNGTGTPAIVTQKNVTSITDQGTGDFKINFTADLASANYVAVGLCGISNNFVTIEAQLVGSLEINTPNRGSGIDDCVFNSIVILL